MSEVETLRREIDKEVGELIPGLDADRREQLSRVCALSEYFHKHFRSHPAEMKSLVESGVLERRYASDEYRRILSHLTVENLDSELRRIRQREMCRIVYRDLSRTADLAETTQDLSNFADAAIDIVLGLHYESHCERYGTPMGARSGKPQRMSVLALGKLGACELNLSSDIDLVFLYEEQGQVEGKGRDLSNQEFFVRTARALINSLDRIDDSGFVFRVDMRLRPYGESGALILHRAAMEKYFIEQGRDWERYAFIKARPCGGDVELGQSFLNWLIPFVYRKHLDYGAIDALREMKRLINYEVDVKNQADDLKLGHGGIREIEFVIQACQIIWGGNEPRYRDRRLLVVMSLLEEDGKLPAEDIDRLRAAYEFLRNSEHVLQAEFDRQTQRLPESPLSRERLAVAMGFEHYDSYLEELNRHRRAVSESFESFMSSNRAEREALVEGNLYWVSIWRDPTSQESIEWLDQAGFADAEGTARRIAAFDSHLEDSDVQEIGAARIDRLMPVLLGLVAREANPDAALDRLLAIIDSISRRSTYVAYLLENFDALKRTVNLCAMSPWVAERLQNFPILLYELSDRVTDDTLFERDQLAAELQQLMQNLESGDLEAQMDSLRQFKNGAVLKVAVFELLDLLPIMKASDALTDVAEIVLDRAFELAWNYLADRHGEPCRVDGEPVGRSFAIVAYGKLGGIELGYGSDLDLVFLHDADVSGKTNGDRAIDNRVFYSRLGQRLVHILTSYTQFGVLYEVDLRLRPNGTKGPMVSTLSAYQRYLEEDAWTWEHQALVRARFVGGNRELERRFEAIRQAVIGRQRDRDKLLGDVVSMREKMRTHLEKPPEKTFEDGTEDEVLLSGFDLKHGAGAIVDIEFMVQYIVLAYSCEYPALTKWTDKMRILDEMKPLGLLTAEEIRILQEAYLAYRSAVHYQWLGGEMSSFEKLNRYRQDVVEIWSRYMTPAATE